VALAIAVVAVGVGTGLYWWTRAIRNRESPGGTAQPEQGAVGAAVSPADQDYFAELRLAYESHAIVCLARFWINEGEKLPGFHETSLTGSTRATAACNMACDLCEKARKEVEGERTELRKAFVARHRMDSADYKATFKKRFPERDVIFDEVAQDAELFARTEATLWTGKLVDERSKIVGKAIQEFDQGNALNLDAAYAQWWDAREAMLRAEVLREIRLVRERARNLTSIRSIEERLQR
jgi:hypothetical protein